MTKMLIKNGFVYDPLNNINGEKMDIAIENGVIVEKVGGKRVKIIDASGMVVMPGGVDIHSHIAGAKVNSGRLLRPEDHFKDAEQKTIKTRAGVGYSVPSTFTTGYRYAKMGYTTVMDPAMPPLKARHTHEELNDTPIIDKASYPLLGDWWFVLEYLQNGLIEECAAHVAWLMNATKGYAIKLVNPGGLEAWGFGKNVHSLEDSVPYFNITPKEIIRGLCRVNAILNMPHSIHVHTNNLGIPGNYLTTLETMKCVEDLANSYKPVLHITHCQFSAFAGEDWRTFDSGAEKIANYVNNRDHVTLDMGQVVFTDTTTMTADGPFQFTLYELTGNKWVNHDVETETSAGVVPFHYRKKSFVHAMQWSIGLELALLIDNPWKIFLTTDHPNAGPFTAYPKIVSWLMSWKSREKTIRKINKKATRKSLLPSINREYTLYEVTIITRAGAAKALGLKNKGHLGLSADADIAIYNVNPEDTDLSKKPEILEKSFEKATYTIKNGKIVVKNGEIVDSFCGKTFWTNVKAPKYLMEVEPQLQKKFEDYYTIKYENYQLSEDYLAISHPITVEARLQ
jgi:formylmethanofuran dehydrogenase subunit A